MVSTSTLMGDDLIPSKYVLILMYFEDYVGVSPDCRFLTLFTFSLHSFFFDIQVEICRILYTVDVQYTGYKGSAEHIQTSPLSLSEQPSCPVCLGICFSFLHCTICPLWWFRVHLVSELCSIKVIWP